MVGDGGAAPPAAGWLQLLFSCWLAAAAGWLLLLAVGQLGIAAVSMASTYRWTYDPYSCT